MSKRITDISKLLELVENGTLKITSVQCKTKALADITEIEDVTPTDFFESLQYLNESKLFKDGIDFFFKIMDKHSIRIECGLKNPYLDECFYADCLIEEGISTSFVESKLRETIFDKMNEKIAV